MSALSAVSATAAGPLNGRPSSVASGLITPNQLGRTCQWRPSDFKRLSSDRATLVGRVAYLVDQRCSAYNVKLVSEESEAYARATELCMYVLCTSPIFNH